MDSNYSLASSTLSEEDLAALQQTIASGRFTMGERVAAFEQAFAQFQGSKYCVMVNSGSSANLIMTAALCYRQEGRLQRGDEVIVPAISWSTTYQPLHLFGLKLKFVDIDKSTLNYDVDQLKEAISSKTRLLVCVNLLGNPNQFDVIQQLCQQHDVIMIEDNC